ncbi:fasciclin domain-containing protein [Actinoplanes sp. NPDC026670]|uniref:fasciclin domain-containing protein n=1 Tax=Actinoplanes sp. NPDC026670 TaxID=3154700 RepID=UPI0033F67D63
MHVLRGLLAGVLTLSLGGCGFIGRGGVVTGQPLPSGSVIADACAPQNLAAMEGKPVVAAIAANPGLSQLLAGFKRAGLQTFDDVPALTLFATSDQYLMHFPFQNIPMLWDNPDSLARVLKQSAVEERLDLDHLLGRHTTMSSTQAVVTNDAEGLRVNRTRVVCRQLDTANAAVYIVNDLVAYQ